MEDGGLEGEKQATRTQSEEVIGSIGLKTRLHPHLLSAELSRLAPEPKHPIAAWGEAEY